VGIERRGSSAIVRLQRPDRGNALDASLPPALAAAIEQVGEEPDVTGVVLTGLGRFFCTGGDMATLADWHRLDVEERAQRFLAAQVIVEALRRCPVPVVAAVNGPAAGAGVDLALAADLRVAVSTATFTAAFAGVGLVPDLGGSWFLTRRLGRSGALRFLLGETVEAQRALDLGLVDLVVEERDLLSAARRMLDRMASETTREALSETLFAVRNAEMQELPASLAAAARAQAELMGTEGHRERVAAFLSA
jgi:2-(1,2-epoxy-1,2-dihydrophenyl)acetyl-CoA isomerase